MIKRERQIIVLIAFAVVAAATGAPQARSKVSQQETGAVTFRVMGICWHLPANWQPRWFPDSFSNEFADVRDITPWPLPCTTDEARWTRRAGNIS